MKTREFKTQAEWLEWRMTGIGASEAAAVLNCCPFKTREELWALKTERMLPQKSSFPMRRGKDLEPLARAEYERLTEIPMPACYGAHDKFPHILVSLDGFNCEIARPLEIKCPGQKDHATALRGKVPDHYVWQCVQILAVTDCPEMDYFSFDGKKGKIVPFKRDLRLEKILLLALHEFWNLVCRDISPVKTAKTTFKELSFQDRLATVIALRGTK